MKTRYFLLGLPIAAAAAGWLAWRPGGESSVVPQAWPAIAARFYAGGLQAPVGVFHAGDQSNRLFVVEQPGRIRIVKDGVLAARPFLAIEPRVLYGGERGLLGLAFPPAYSAKGYFYVDYTRQPDGATVVSRIRVSSDPDLALADSEEILLTIPQPFPNHNGGEIAFGPLDGYLYIAMGDGGSAGDPFNNAQNPASLLGKLLRIDTESGPGPYRVPPTNPFVGRPPAAPEVWALGLRNPWRFAFDRKSGELYIGDVGQNAWEEIDVLPADSPGGANFGWRILEGYACYDPPAGCIPPAGYVAPVVVYGHAEGCSVTGGYVYRAELHPDLEGIYFYGDYCTGTIWGLRRNGTAWESALLLDTPYSISTFGEDEKGDLFVADHASGTLYLLSGERLKKGRIPR